MITTDEGEKKILAAGVPEMRIAFVPKGSYKILDTWYSGGLRGTGSHDVVVVEDIFVPADMTFFIEDQKYIDRPLYRMPLAATMGAWCSAICIRIARTSIDTLLDLDQFIGASGTRTATSRSAGGSGYGGVQDCSLGGRAYASS